MYMLTNNSSSLNLQDCIGTSDIKGAVGEIFGGKYESYFNDPGSDKNDKKPDLEMTRHEDYNDQEGTKTRSITGIAWNKERYLSSRGN